VSALVPAAITRDGKMVLAINGERKWRWYPLSGGASQPAPGFEELDDPMGVVVGSTYGNAIFVRSGTAVPSRIDRVAG